MRGLLSLPSKKRQLWFRADAFREVAPFGRSRHWCHGRWNKLLATAPAVGRLLVRLE